jgi:multicomponent Na+:H+ antiporter subunit E
MLLANLLLALAWTALQGEVSLSNLAVGYGLGYVVLQVLTRGGVLPVRYLGKVSAFLSLFFYLIYELVVANFKLAGDVLSPGRTLRPAIVKVPLDVESDAEILMFAALINLTPGSTALDTSEDRRTMFVHVMHMETPDQTRAEMKQGFERRVRRLFE